ncbi:unnamed protein product [Callosobruchus maculatus]|uniref:Gamma-interferon-inducible lysosomal thiol reductase n=1 Tax=Callosobruchus maculatus TaxID=64391 RepID=A0A653DIG9_CALMS|nr:unnamed protein product [Callosobruchus maculatus]
MVNLVYIVVILSVLSFAQAANKLKVSVYYETLSEGCGDFIQNQLHPVYSQFEDYLELDMVPWGFAVYGRVKGKNIFRCEYGPKQCYGNMIHACALDSNPPKTALDFINCCEGQANSTSDAAFQKCSKEVGIEFKDLKHCSETKGEQLQVKNAEKSKYRYNWIPFVTFNEIYDEAECLHALENLKEVVCKHFADNPPEACAPPKNVSSVSRA